MVDGRLLSGRAKSLVLVYALLGSCVASIRTFLTNFRDVDTVSYLKVKMSKWTDILPRNVGKKLPIHTTQNHNYARAKVWSLSQLHRILCLCIYTVHISYVTKCVDDFLALKTQRKRTVCRLSKSLRHHTFNAILETPLTIILELSSLEQRRALNAIFCTLTNITYNKLRSSWSHQTRNNILLQKCN
jgi:hypothetical protein